MSLFYHWRKRGLTAARHFEKEETNMATTHEDRPIAQESDGAHVTFVKDHHLGLAADPATERPAESKWLSASVARDLINAGFAVESEPAPKAAHVDIEAEVRAKADANGLVFFRMISTGLILQMHWDVAVQKIRQGVADLV
jgi:hypothetical protein